VLLRQLTDGLGVFSHVDTNGDAPRWSDTSGCSTAQRQPVINAIEPVVLRKRSRCGRLTAILVMETAENGNVGDTMPVGKLVTG
jgi:hypothetical protein